MAIDVRKAAFEHVDDMSGLRSWLAGEWAADEVIAAIGKTEGSGGVSDFSRLAADRAFREALRGAGAIEGADRVPAVWSGGADGVLSPHATFFRRYESASDSPDPRLVVGIARSDAIVAEDVGRASMVDKVAVGVRRAMADAGIEDPRDVAMVFTKSPLLTLDTVRNAGERGVTVRTAKPNESLPLSSGAAALGVAVALGDVDHVEDESIGRDLSLWTARASSSSGVEHLETQIVLLGNRAGAGGRLRVGRAVMRDALDADAVYAAVRDAGVDLPERPRAEDLDGRVVNVFVKCDPHPDGRLRGRRQLLLEDSEISYHHHIKAAVGGIVAAAIGDPAVYVSSAAVHQGPPGGGTVAAIVDVS